MKELKVGDKFKIPEEYCGHKGTIVWMSEDKKTIGVQCPEYHSRDPITKEKYKPKRVWKGSEAYKEIPIKKRDIVLMLDLGSDL